MCMLCSPNVLFPYPNPVWFRVQVCNKLAVARRDNRAAFLQQLAIVNWQLDLPHWGQICNKVRVLSYSGSLASSYKTWKGA
jgi:hypothetical protein